MANSKSWGHTLQKLPPSSWGRDHPCAARCEQLATHLSTYKYRTGRAGRIAWASRGLCDVHADRFRAKHDLPEPDVATAPRHALERIVGGEAS